MFAFWKIWPALFYWNTRFEIRPFALRVNDFFAKKLYRRYLKRFDTHLEIVFFFPCYTLLAFTCSTSTMNTPQKCVKSVRSYWIVLSLDRSGIFVNFEQISHIVLVFPLFTSNKWMPARIKTSGRTSSNTLFEAYTYYS